MFLMGTKKWQNPRCQTYRVIHPYIPGMKLLHQPTRLTRRRKRNKKKKKKNKDKSDETDESPMILDEEDRSDEKEIQKKQKGIFLLSLTYLQKKH